MGDLSDQLKIKLQSLLSRFYPHINFIFIFTNPLKIVNFFNYKKKPSRSYEVQPRI